MKYFVKDFSTSVLARILVFGMQVDDDLLYPGIGNQPSPVYFSLYLSNFLSNHTLMTDIFIKDFSTIMHTRMLIFGMQIGDDLFYHEIGNHISTVYSSCICPFFFPSLLRIMRFLTQISPQPCKLDLLYLLYWFLSYNGIEN